MPCPVHNAGSDENSSIDRREFVKTALVIGGTSALAAVQTRAHGDGGADGDGHDMPPPGTDDLDSLPNRQYAWDDFCAQNSLTDMAKTPNHHLQLVLNYVGDRSRSDEDDDHRGRRSHRDGRHGRGRGGHRGRHDDRDDWDDRDDRDDRDGWDHEWDDRDDDWNDRDGTPTDSEREQVEEALRTLERAYEWSHKGLLFSIGYSNSYFDRYDEDLPPNTGLIPPERVIEQSDIARSGRIDPVHADAHLHMASDTVVPLLEAEAALRGEVDEIGHGVEVEATFRGVFDVTERRTGFIGNPHEKWDEELRGRNPVPEGADVWFGFKSLFSDSQPSEDVVAISDEDHPFYDGTTEQVSLLLDNNIRQWHSRFDHEEQVARMYSPHHTSEDTGPFGRELSPTSGTENRREDGKTMDEIAERTAEDAEERGVVGHAQKLARARKGDDNTPPLLRRDFPSTDGGRTHTQFISNQRTIQDFIDVRRAMAFVDHEADDPRAESEVPIKNHGIQGHFKVQSRGTFLVPPRSLRALPPADP